MRLLVLAALATLFVLTCGQGPPGPPGPQGPAGDPGTCIGCPDVVSHPVKPPAWALHGPNLCIAEFLLQIQLFTCSLCYSFVEPRSARVSSKFLQ